jgi:hypothetical protein
MARERRTQKAGTPLPAPALAKYPSPAARSGGAGYGVPVFCLLLAIPLFAQIDGTVINASTGMPQAGVAVSLIHPGENGMETLGTATSGADGGFKIAKDLPSPPALLRATFQDVEYNQIVPPGTPSTGIKLSVYEATNKRSADLAEQHLIVVEPGADGIRLSETFLVQNSGKTTFMDPLKGSIQFYLPKEAQASTKVIISPPNNIGISITRAPEKTAQADVFKAAYAIKPGQTEFDVAYVLPPAAKFTGHNLGSGPEIIVSAESVKLSGGDLKDDGIKQLGQGGPRAHVYEVLAKAGASYEVSVEGTGALQTAQDAGPSEEDEDGGSPKPRAGQARIYERLPWVLGLAFGILALGGTLLYRRSAASL